MAFAVGVGPHEEPLSGHDEDDADGGNEEDERVFSRVDPEESRQDDDVEQQGDGHDGTLLLRTVPRLARRRPP